jgi:hypothetical protein
MRASSLRYRLLDPRLRDGDNDAVCLMVGMGMTFFRSVMPAQFWHVVDVLADAASKSTSASIRTK